MAQSGFTPIKLYLSTTAAAVPTAANLEPGELALNNNDGKLFYEDSSGVVQVIATKDGASGDVVGPASATDNAVARYDGTTGKIIQNSAVTIADDGATVIAANSSSDGLRITQVGAGNALLVEDSANPDSTPFVVDSTGRVLSGHTAAISATIGQAQFEAFSTSGSQTALFQYSTDAIGAQFELLKSGSATIGANTIVASGDTLGSIRFSGADGTGFIRGAQIFAQVDGTPGTNDMPGRLVFSTTADGASSPTERMRIDNAGRVGIGTSTLTGYGIRTAQNITGAVISQGIGLTATVQSDVTTSARGVWSNLGTQATAFTLSNLVHFYSQQGTIGAGSAVTNQFGFAADSGLTGATNNYGFHSSIASGTGRWNFYAAGTADNYFAGSVGIGGTPYAGSSLVVGKANTGSTQVYAVSSEGTIQSDVTGTARLFTTAAKTQATAFTLSALKHYSADQGTFGASSVVTNQYGYSAESTLTGATNNYGFYGNIASGTGRYNFYAAGTAANYFAGQTSIGTTSAIGQLNVVGSQGLIVGAPSTAETAVVRASEPLATYLTNFKSTSLQYNGTTATGTTSGITNADLGLLNFTNVANALIQTNGATPLIFATTSTQRMQISAGGTISLGAAPGSESLRVTPVASAVNYWNFQGNNTGAGIEAMAQGSDTNIGMYYKTKGNSSQIFWNGSSQIQFRINDTASAVNYLQVTGSATGSAATLSAAGSDTNIDITLTPKGSGYVVVDAAYSPNLTLTDAATITWDTSTAGGQVATFTFVSSNRTMGAPTNLKNGGFYALAVIQNAGSNTLTWNAVFKWAGGTAPTLSTAAGAKDYFVFRSDGTSLFQQGISQAVA